MRLYGKNYTRYMFIPLALFIIFLAMIFVFPGIQRGMDLTGGTSYIFTGLEEAPEAKAVEQHLMQNFNLSDLRVTTVSSPLGFGLNIEFAENLELAEAKAELDEARALLDSSPEESAERSKNALSLLAPFVEGLPPGNPKDLLEFADEAFGKAKQAFEKSLLAELEANFPLGNSYSVQSVEVGPSLSATFWENAVFVAIVAFIAVIFVVFFFFREIIPSAAIIAAAVFDISGALALMSLTGIPLSLSSIPALLMLVGYSVDTDIMLTTRLIKRKERSPKERTTDSMKTGLTMTFTTIAALSAMIVLAFFNQMTVIFSIAAVLLFGLLADLISTWLMNAPVLLWYVEKKSRRLVV